MTPAGAVPASAPATNPAVVFGLVQGFTAYWTAVGAVHLGVFDALAAGYEATMADRAEAITSRAARLLAGLFLGRVDGKSPVEYVTEEGDKDHVRRVARALLVAPPPRLSDVRDAWNQELAR